ncbi:1640_t:CDS:1, partial [Funneliformis geosporum]
INKKAKFHASNSSPVYESASSSQPQDKQKKKALGSKSICVSDDSSEIVGGDLEVKKDTIDISPELFPSQSLIISQDSGDVSEMFKK